MKIQTAATPITNLSVICILLIAGTVLSGGISSSFIAANRQLLHSVYKARLLLQDACTHDDLQKNQPTISPQLNSSIRSIVQFPAHKFFWQGAAIAALQSKLDTSWNRFLQASRRDSAQTDTKEFQQVVLACDEMINELSRFPTINAINSGLFSILLGTCVIILLYILYYSHHFIRDKLAFQASHDPLTKLLNRNVYNELVETEIARSERYKYSMSLILFDIDNFKKVNDTYGHDVGDMVLVQLSQLVKSLIRMSDSLFRTGGEEFAIIAPETGTKAATFLAEKLRSAINSATFDEAINITVSFGLAEYHYHEGSAKLFRRADQALYRAKNTGRNRVEGAE
ncbi:MAG: GGDEF domain-containing protein [Candidatus Cloacimonetes bacterium]|nr:GGDEF domain-containing protein [Candidatus Cloacimonadota bacterium]